MTSTVEGEYDLAKADTLETAVPGGVKVDAKIDGLTKLTVHFDSTVETPAVSESEPDPENPDAEPAEAEVIEINGKFYRTAGESLTVVTTEADESSKLAGGTVILEFGANNDKVTPSAEDEQEITVTNGSIQVTVDPETNKATTIADINAGDEGARNEEFTIDETAYFMTGVGLFQVAGEETKLVKEATPDPESGESRRFVT